MRYSLFKKLKPAALCDPGVSELFLFITDGILNQGYRILNKGYLRLSFFAKQHLM